MLCQMGSVQLCNLGTPYGSLSLQKLPQGLTDMDRAPWCRWACMSGLTRLEGDA